VIVNMLEAKTQLSRLIALAESGEEVVIARAGVPAARLTSVASGPRVFGGDPSVALPSDSPFFDALPEDELAAWE
jgi:prevent-host-death family protein